ncbi:hypothetical protein [Oleiagrimonas sp.]|uniref:hypothetical protein n=1 Tax=Oleiagrimonas sp. TaxID=2010330 RepID=UPI00262B6373|nr:hypothetical protein [Oleiagrimonas sp.]MDA3913546.1 hypothetical protein [Oleiagrimonas sp.]
MLLLSSASPGLAQADPWIPARGHGVVNPMLRYFSANNAFSGTQFGTGTSPSSQQRETQFRFTGTQGIGGRLSIQYDLRGGALQKTRHHAGQTITSRSSGLEDQEVGLNYGLRQTASFADSIALNVVLPTGSATRVPALGAGKAAIEPDYQIGINRGLMFVTLLAGPRIFVGGGAIQLRTSANLGYRVSPRFSLGGSLFYVRTIHRQQAITINPGEIYNLLRLGVRLQYHPSGHFRQWRPFLTYEDSVAGQGIHAGKRIVLGVSVHY